MLKSLLQRHGSWCDAKPSQSAEIRSWLAVMFYSDSSGTKKVFLLVRDSLKMTLYLLRKMPAQAFLTVYLVANLQYAPCFVRSTDTGVAAFYFFV